MQILKKGSRGRDVITLQKALTAAGFSCADDGVFGAETEAQVMAFQKANGLGVDGIVGGQTWAKLGAQPAENPWVEGVDTSHWEKGFDFVKGVKDGIVFMMTKATEGVSYVDDTCDSLCKKAKDAGIKYRGVYHFFHTKFSVAKQVALYFGKYVPLKTEMPPILDLEETSVDGYSYHQVREAALDWLQQAETRSGKIPILYVDMNMLNLLQLNSDPRFNKYPRWIARYSKNEPGVKWTFWQFTDKGEQGADTDWFHGNESDLRKFLGIA